MTTSTDDLQLVELLRQRDEEAFVTLVRQYGPQIRRWVARRVDDPFEVDDLVQEVLVSTWRSSDRLREDTVLPTWLKTIADNACKMRARSRARKPSTPTGLVPDDHGVESVDVAAVIDVEAALRQLPEREAGILRLLYSEDRPLEEAAGLLNLSQDAAKSLAARARRRFRSTFESWFRVAGAAWVPLRFAEVADRVPVHMSMRTGVAAASAVLIAVAGAGGPISRQPAPQPIAAPPDLHAQVAATHQGGSFTLPASRPMASAAPGLGPSAWATDARGRPRSDASGRRGDGDLEAGPTGAASQGADPPGQGGSHPLDDGELPGEPGVGPGQSGSVPEEPGSVPGPPETPASPGPPPAKPDPAPPGQGEGPVEEVTGAAAQSTQEVGREVGDAAAPVLGTPAGGGQSVS